MHLLAFHHPDELPHGEPLERSRIELGKFCRSIEYFPLWPKKSALHKLVAFGVGSLIPEPFSVLAHKSGALADRIESLCAKRACDIVHLDTIALAPYREHCGTVPAVLVPPQHRIAAHGAPRGARDRTPPRAVYVAAQSRKLLDYERVQPRTFPTQHHRVGERLRDAAQHLPGRP